MADFGGWSMPIEYPGGGVVAEHTAVRERVGIFDVSHLGRARVSGPGAADFVNACLTNDLRRIGPGQAQYTMCCTSSGGVVDDLIQYLRSDEDVFLIPNAANTARVVEMVADAAPEGVVVENLHDRYGVIAVQGPRSDEVLRGLGFPVDHDYMSFVETEWEGLPVIVCRTGYTGERGYEIVPAWTSPGRCGTPSPRLSPGRRPAVRPRRPGHPAHRDGLPPPRQRPLPRHHAGHGRCGVGRRVGQAGVLGQGGAHRRACGEDGPPHARARCDRARHPPPHCPVKDASGAVVGEVTSGTFSPTLRQGVGLAFIDRVGDGGRRRLVDVRGRDLVATVSKPPFVEVGVREK